jgi:hypothetical protein
MVFLLFLIETSKAFSVEMLNRLGFNPATGEIFCKNRSERQIKSKVLDEVTACVASDDKDVSKEKSFIYFSSDSE